MADIAFIIGNGFDVDMGLPSKYSDFIESKEWKDVVKGVDGFLKSNDYYEHSLIAQLIKASNKSLWFDVEEEIHKFIIKHPDNTENDIRDIKAEFEIIKKSLTKYLNRISKDFKADEKKLGYQLLAHLQNSPFTIFEIIFNYTYPHSFLKIPTYYKGCFVSFVHGSLKENNIVLGCDLQDGEEVNKQLSFMYKYNMLTTANNAGYHLQEAKEIIFYGHSLNEMDFRYFRAFLTTLSTTPCPSKHLTIITFDETSERNIKDNIQSQGVSVTGLYNNLRTFEFIHTQKYNNGEDSEKHKVKDLFDRLNNLEATRLKFANE